MPDDGPLRGAPKSAKPSPFGKTTERIQRPIPASVPRTDLPSTPRPVPAAASTARPVSASVSTARPVSAAVLHSGPASTSRPDAPPASFQPPGTPMYSASVGELALLQLIPRLNTLSADRLERPHVDLEPVAIGAIELARLVHEPMLRARFRALPPSEFDPEWLELLEPLGWALWHIHRANLAASSALSAVVPVELSEAAVELERKMQTCVEYHLSDHPDAGPKVAFLRVGTGYRDLAGDLMGYAELYRDYRDELCHDRKNYREGDADEAVKLATRLFEALALGQGGDQHRLMLRDRTWTLLARCYDEIAATGRWLLRHDPNVSSFFPALRALGRAGALRKGLRPSNTLGLSPPPASI
jgi:hypothetical protein